MDVELLGGALDEAKNPVDHVFVVRAATFLEEDGDGVLLYAHFLKNCHAEPLVD